MNAFIIVLVVLGVVAIATVIWDVRTDGYRAHPVDPVLRQRLLDREEVRRTSAEAAASLEAARSAPVPPALAARRTSTRAARASASPAHRPAC